MVRPRYRLPPSGKDSSIPRMLKFFNDRIPGSDYINDDKKCCFCRRIMKRKILVGCILFVFAGLVLIGTTTGQSSKGSAGDGRLLTVLNPVMADRFVERVPLTPRLDTLEGKTIYLYDTQWGGPEAANSVYEEIQAWFAKNIPSATVVIHKGPNWMANDTAFLQVITDKKIDAVLIGISG